MSTQGDLHIKRTLKEKIKRGIWKLSRISASGIRDSFYLTDAKGRLLDTQPRLSNGNIIKFMRIKIKE